jgi:hypothetical protein
MPKTKNSSAAHSQNTTARKVTLKQNLTIDYKSVAILRSDSMNPRLHNEKQVRQIARSIEVFGFNVPILINADKRVVAGHGRLQACQLLGITEVPTILVEHVTEAQARAFMIADNKLTENASTLLFAAGRRSQRSQRCMRNPGDRLPSWSRR